MLMSATGCRIINGALNYQIYARPSFEIISLALEDPSDRKCAAADASYAECANFSCVSMSCCKLRMC
jgi:hypothetical protein